MTRRVRLGFGLATVLVACESASSLDADVPPAVAWLAAAAVVPDTNEVSSSTILQPAGAKLALSRLETNDLWILGFEAEPIDRLRFVVEAMGSDFEQLRSAAPLASPDACIEQLPAPSWGRFIGPLGASREVPRGEVPPFRAPWLSGVCAPEPDVPGRDADMLSPLSLEVNGKFCGRDALSQTGCDLEFRWERCNIGAQPPLDLRREWDDRVCVVRESECVPMEKGELGLRSAGFRCEPSSSSPLELRIHRPKSPEDVSFVRAEHVRVIDGALPELPPTDWITPDLLQRNHLSAMLELDTRVVVSTHPSERCGLVCPEPAVTQLVFVDRDSMEIVRTATAPPCLTRLAPHPEGGFVGAFQREHTSFDVARFDDGGRVVATTHLMDAPAEPPALWIAGLEYLPELDRYVVILAPNNRAVREIVHSDNHILLFDRELAVVSRGGLPFLGDRVAITSATRVSTPSGDRLLLEEDAGGRYLLTDLEVTEIQRSAGLPVGVGLSRRTHAVLQLDDERLLFAAGGDLPVLGEVFPSSENNVRLLAHQFEALAESSVLAPFGPDVVLAVVRPQASGAEAIYLSRFDTRAFRFLPGSPRLRMPDGSDPGAATRSLVDSKGRIWLGFARSPFLTRLEPSAAD